MFLPQEPGQYAMQTPAQRRSSVAAAALTAARPSRTSPIALIHSAVPSAAGRTRDLGIHSQAARHNPRSRSVAAAASRRDSDSAAQPSSTGRLSRTGKAVGWSVLPGDDDDDRLSDNHDADAAEPGPRTYDDDEVRVPRQAPRRGWWSPVRSVLQRESATPGLDGVCCWQTQGHVRVT